MKIRIETDDYREFVEFPIAAIKYQIDEKGPIDIEIYGTEEALNDICDFALIGCNMQEIDKEIQWRKSLWEATHECLIARLPKFTIIEADICFYE